MKTKKEKVSVGMVNPPVLKTIDEIEARRNFARFQAETLAEYEAFITGLSDTDMRAHASTVGLKPSANRSQLLHALTSYFTTAKSKVARYESGPVNIPRQVISRHDDYAAFMARYKAQL